MDPSFKVDLPVPLSGSLSAPTVTTLTASASAPLSLSGAGAATDKDASPHDSSLPTADHYEQQAGSVAPWLANIKRRAPIACRRCRRQRSKCEHDKARPPCKSCKEAGLGEEDCIFPVRGQPGNDREYRHPRQRAPKGSKSAVNGSDAASVTSAPEGRAAPRPRAPPDPSKPANVWKVLPPKDDILDAVERFTSNYFQLGFIPKQQFRDKLRDDLSSVDPFLLLGILGISARMTPALIKAHGSGVKASEYFTEKQFEIAAHEIYMGPTLERCQAFYLLSLAQQGSGHRNLSYLNVGIATRMSTLMQLHREETYEMDNPTTESIISAESARRTMWMLHSQDSLHSGPFSPVTLGAPDITTLLPCYEEDFAAGRQPASRAALPDSPPAVEKPHLVCDPGRSLFASLMQIHHYWGTVSRRAASFAKEPAPWDSRSDFCVMKKKLDDWEDGLPPNHHWSKSQLFQFKSRGLDLAYLSVTMMPRLCNIVLRRPYLVDVMFLGEKSIQQQNFFTEVSADMFSNVRDLFEQIDAQFTGRSVDESVGAQMAAFCVYVCGLFSTYLCLYPNLCPDPSITRHGPAMVKRTKEILSECDRVWPLASRWVDSLERAFNQPHQAPLMSEGSMTDGKDPVPQAWLKRSNTVPQTEPTSASASATNGNFQNNKVTSPLDTVMASYPPHHSAAPVLQQHQSVPIYHSSAPGFSPVDMPQEPTSQAGPLPYAPQGHISHDLMSQGSSGQMYIPAHQAADGMGGMIMSGTFHASSPAMPHHPAQSHASGQHQQQGYMLSQGAAPFYPQAGPGNDGFEDELQAYMGGKGDRFLPTSWSGPF